MAAQKQSMTRNTLTSANGSFCPRSNDLPSSHGTIALTTHMILRATSSAYLPSSWPTLKSTESIFCPALITKECTLTCIRKDLKRLERLQPSSLILQRSFKHRRVGRDSTAARRHSMQPLRLRKMSMITSWPTSDRYTPLAWNPDGPLLLIWVSNFKTSSLTLTICSKSNSSP